MVKRDERETPAAMTINQASEAIQSTSPDESAAIEREQNQMFSAPGSVQRKTKTQPINSLPSPKGGGFLNTLSLFLMMQLAALLIAASRSSP